MGFGKRGLTSPSRPGSPLLSDGGAANAELRSARTGGSQGGASGVVVGVMLVIVGIIAGVGGALVHSSWFDAGGASPAVAAVAASRSGAHARIADACMPPLPPRGTTLRRINVSDADYRYQRALASPDYFTCALTRERERFCKSEEKAALVKELQAYFAHIAAGQHLYDTYSGDRTAKTMMKMADAVESDEGGISSRRQRPEADASVIAVMQNLARDGYLESGDFGWSVPAEIAPHLQGIEKVKSPC